MSSSSDEARDQLSVIDSSAIEYLLLYIQLKDAYIKQIYDTVLCNNIGSYL